MSQQPTRGISCEVTLNGVSTKQDGTLSLRIQTSREFNAVESVALMELNRMILNMQLVPLRFEDTPLEIEGSAESKSASERLRNCIFVWFKSEQDAKRLPPDAVFEIFRQQKMEMLIEFVKRKLPEK